MITNQLTEHIKKAIELLAAECYGALSACNAIGGNSSTEWDILRTYSWSEIVKEGQSRELDFSAMECAVTGTPLLRSANVKFALGEITDRERTRIFYLSVKQTGEWPEPEIIHGEVTT